MLQLEDHQCSEERIPKGFGARVAFWGLLVLSTSSTKGLLPRPPYSNPFFGSRAGRPRQSRSEGGWSKSRLFCGGAVGLNQLSTPLRNPFCIVSRASQQVFRAMRRRLPSLGQTAAEDKWPGPAVSIARHMRGSRVDVAGPWTGRLPDRRLRDLLVQSIGACSVAGCENDRTSGFCVVTHPCDTPSSVSALLSSSF